MKLSDRQKIIFKEVVIQFLKNKIAIGSAQIAKILNERGQKISPSLVRLELAKISDMGLLIDESASSGKSPTFFGIETFVEILQESPELWNLRFKNIFQKNGKNNKSDIENLTLTAGQLTPEMVVLFDGKVKYANSWALFSDSEEFSKVTACSRMLMFEGLEKICSVLAMLHSQKPKVINSNKFVPGSNLSIFFISSNGKLYATIGSIYQNYINNLNLLLSLAS